MTQQFITLIDTTTLDFGESVELTGSVIYDQAHGLLYLVTDEDAEVLSITLDEYGLTTPENHVWIKDWSEHQGIASQLIRQNLVTYKQSFVVGPFDSQAHLVEIVLEQPQGIEDTLMHKSRIYTITDIHTDETVSSQDWEVAIATARTWFPAAPQKVIDQLDALEADPDWPGDPHELRNTLGLNVEYQPI